MQLEIFPLVWESRVAASSFSHKGKLIHNNPAKNSQVCLCPKAKLVALNLSRYKPSLSKIYLSDIKGRDNDFLNLSRGSWAFWTLLIKGQWKQSPGREIFSTWIQSTSILPGLLNARLGQMLSWGSNLHLICRLQSTLFKHESCTRVLTCFLVVNCLFLRNCGRRSLLEKKITSIC